MPRGKPYTIEEIHRMWPQARDELTGFAQALDEKAGITSAQLRMALQLADAAYLLGIGDLAQLKSRVGHIESQTAQIGSSE
jgi:hypothetical protein